MRLFQLLLTIFLIYGSSQISTSLAYEYIRPIKFDWNEVKEYADEIPENCELTCSILKRVPTTIVSISKSENKCNGLRLQLGQYSDPAYVIEHILQSYSKKREISNDQFKRLWNYCKKSNLRTRKLPDMNQYQDAVYIVRSWTTKSGKRKKKVSYVQKSDASYKQAILIGLGMEKLCPSNVKPGVIICYGRSYLKEMHQLSQKISRNWYKKKDATNNLRCIVGFDIHKNGDISNLKIHRTSEDKGFDEHCLAILKKSAPFDKWPMNVSVQFTFKNSDSLK